MAAIYHLLVELLTGLIKIMLKKLRSFIAYFIASFSLIIVTYLFINLGSISEIISKLPFMKINPIFSGGEICNEILKENYKIYVHKPVFPSLIGNSDFGFVQLDYKYSANIILKDSIDYNQDNQVDFYISSSANLDSLYLDIFNREVHNISRNLVLKDGRLIRIGLRKFNKNL